MDRFDNIPETALRWHLAGKGAVLATVVQTWGSAPRKAGSQMAISGNAEIEGSVSGGCVEGAVVSEALDALEDGKPRMLEYGVTDGDAFSVGLACGGTIRIWLEPVGAVLPVDDLETMVRHREQRAMFGYVCNTDTNERRFVGTSDMPDRFRADRSGFEADGVSFVTIQNPPLRLVVVGAVHIAQALVPMAHVAGYDCFIVDPREAFASVARFPGEIISHDWPDEALKAIGLDARTAVVLLSHDPKLDDPAIQEAIGSDAFYIGALGSKRTHAARVERLAEAGFDAPAIARIHGPVGLNIGSSGPAEIAVSILAEMTAVLRKTS
ncbi:MAG: XdhC family protein [Paracoccaceae bacterium]|jgi:xanthine dehydrogenase accessory factor|nr:XdhC family protein [Paracoccaceae bacterium]